MIWFAALVVFLFAVTLCAAAAIAQGMGIPLPWENAEPRATSQDDYFTCDACGTGPWHKDWWPEYHTMRKPQWLCPNCTGAD